MDNDTAKLKAIIHYICRKMATEPSRLGAVKLQKILWFTDIKSYRLKGEMLTGAQYIRKEYGPFMPDLDKIIKELENNNKLRTNKVDYFSYDKREFIGIGEPDVSMLADRELRWLDENIDYICNTHTATSISEKTHDEMWQGAEMYAPLPVSAAAIRFVRPSEESIEWAKKELGIN